MQTMRKISMQTIKVLLAFALALSYCTVITRPMAYADDGSLVTYSYDAGTKTLTVSGYGAVPDEAFIGSRAIYELPGDIERVVIGEGITSLGADLFNSSADTLRSVHIAASVTSIGDYAFYPNWADDDTPDFTELTIAPGSRLQSIGMYAFGGSALSGDVYLPEGCEVGENAFGTTGAVSAKYYERWPEAEITIDPFGEGWSFDEETQTLTFTQNYSSEMGKEILNYLKRSEQQIVAMNFAEGVTEVSMVPASNYLNCQSTLESVYISASVESLATGAFDGCRSLTSVVFKEGSKIASIKALTFRNCSSLTSIDLSNTQVTAISGQPFQNCSSLTSITLPETLTTVGDHAFNGCTALTSLVLPDSVTSIEDAAFQSCDSLGIVVLPANLESFVQSPFNPSEITYKVPGNMSDAAIEAISWIPVSQIEEPEGEHNYGTPEIVETDDGVTVVRKCVFDDETQELSGDEAVSWLLSDYIPALKSEIDAKATEIESLSSSIEDKDAEIEGYKGQLNDANSALQNAIATVSEKEALVATLTATVSKLEDEITDLEKSLESASSSSSANASAVASLRTELSEAKAQLATAQEQLATSTSELSQAKTDLQAAQGQVATLQEQLKAAQGQNGTDAETIKQLQQQLTEAQGKLTELQGQLDTSVSVANSLKTQLTEAQDKATGLETQLKDAQSQLGAAQKEASGLQEQVTTLQQQLAASQSALEQAPVVAQTIKVVNNKTVKASKKTGKLAKAKKLTMLKAKGKLTVTKVKGSKKLTVTKSGKIKVKKGTKKGTYKIRVKVKAAASGKYANAVTVVTLEVRVR